ncbi:ribose-5-phosphate isomerase [Clostridia bacterium]|nr:ribose-5-phosphate isomerase [Clostridia bacterium]
MIAIACDHGGLNLKKTVVDYLKSAGIPYKDFGTDGEASCDYSDYAYRVTASIQNREAESGILICGTGIGMSMAANKARGIRAAVCCDVFSAKMTRAHNDANILCLGERVTGPGHALEIVKAFLGAGEAEGGRHAARRDKISAYEKEHIKG